MLILSEVIDKVFLAEFARRLVVPPAIPGTIIAVTGASRTYGSSAITLQLLSIQP